MKIIYFNDVEELIELTGLSNSELWDVGINLDDWDYGLCCNDLDFDMERLLSGSCSNEQKIIKLKTGKRVKIGMAYHS